jgi:Cdc6-like AAA superfamily ATPase
MDALLDDCQNGGWGTLYGPAGSQKTHYLKCRSAQAATQAEPRIVLIEIPGMLTPTGLLAQIAQKLGAPYAQSSEGLRTSIQFHVRARRAPLALVLDEVDLLYKCVDTLEALRRLADVLPVKREGGGLGLLLVGNEKILDLFKPRRSNYLEQWRSRVGQRSLCVLGPTRDEAREMVRGELGERVADRAPEDFIENCVVPNPLMHKEDVPSDIKRRKDYVSTRKLFFSLNRLKRKLEKGNGKERTQ